MPIPQTKAWQNICKFAVPSLKLLVNPHPDALQHKDERIDRRTLSYRLGRTLERRQGA